MNEHDEMRVAYDRLPGAKACSEYTGDPVWKIYADAGKRPGLYRDGRRIVGSKRVLREDHFNRARAGE